ncbi:MAG TPA: glycosyltransferase family A protein [Actinomycetota bacterium]
MAPLVSVVIPTKNRPRLVGRAVASALSQEGPSVEVVLVDDGSDPEAAAVVEEVGRSDPRIRHVRNEVSIGNPASRNRGFEEASGELWCTLDDDDELTPGRLRAQVAAITGAPDVIAVAGVELRWIGREALVQLPKIGADPVRLDGDRDPFERLSPRLFLNTYLVPAELMRTVDGYDPVLRWGEHTDLFLRLQKVARFVGIGMVGTIVHRDAAPGPARQAWDRKVVGVSRILDKHRDVFERNPELRAIWLDGLGMAELRTGRRGDARRTFREALKANPRRTRILRHLVAATTHTESILCRGRAERVPA